MITPEWEALRAFRHQVYLLFGCRRDALFEALDAVLSAPLLETPAHLSLAPSCQRGWGSLYDALNAGTMDLAQLAALVASYPLEPQTTWYAVDASVWPRCDAETSPDRGYYHHPYRHSHGQPIVAGWNYSWLVHLPSRCASWTAPVRVRRVTPKENLNLVAAEQICSWFDQAAPTATTPIFTFDAGYDAVQLCLALARLPVSLLVCLPAGRCFYADPVSQPSTGRPRRHGAKLVCDDPATWPAPTDTWTTIDAQYGCVCVQTWSGLHAIPHHQAQRGTRRARPPSPRDADSPPGGPLAAPHQDAGAALVLVVWTHPARFGRALTGAHSPFLDRAYLPLFQANAPANASSQPSIIAIIAMLLERSGEAFAYSL